MFFKLFKLRAVLFDRDGAINKSIVMFLNLPFKWLKGSIEALKFLNANVKILVVTNSLELEGTLY